MTSTGPAPGGRARPRPASTRTPRSCSVRCCATRVTPTRHTPGWSAPPRAATPRPCPTWGTCCISRATPRSAHLVVPGHRGGPAGRALTDAPGTASPQAHACRRRSRAAARSTPIRSINSAAGSGRSQSRSASSKCSRVMRRLPTSLPRRERGGRRSGRRGHGVRLREAGDGRSVDALDVDADRGQCGLVEDVPGRCARPPGRRRVRGPRPSRAREGPPAGDARYRCGGRRAAGLLPGHRRPPSGRRRELFEHRRLTSRTWRAPIAAIHPKRHRSVPRTIPAAWRAPPLRPRPARPAGAGRPPPATPQRGRAT